MSSITIRNLDEAVKTNIRIAAARHGRSMEEELRLVLRERYTEQKTAAAEKEEHPLLMLRRLALEAGGFDDFEVPPRQPYEPRITFDP